MYYFLDIEQQINRIFRVVDYEELRKKENSSSQNELNDISDGAYYKSLLEREDGELLKKKEAMTFLLNTDGASICKKSALATFASGNFMPLATFVRPTFLDPWV